MCNVLAVSRPLPPSQHSLYEQPCEVCPAQCPMSHVPCPQSPTLWTMCDCWLQLHNLLHHTRMRAPWGAGLSFRCLLHSPDTDHGDSAPCSYLGRWSAWCRGCWASAGPPPAPCGGSPPPPALLQLAPDNKSSGSLNTGDSVGKMNCHPKGVVRHQVANQP